jgi:excisionase family DNA binding protein
MPSETMEALPLVLRASDIQRLLGISRVKTYELLHQQGFPVVRIGRAMRVPRDAFLRWLEESAVEGIDR